MFAGYQPEEYNQWISYNYTAPSPRFAYFRLVFYNQYYDPSTNNCAYVRNISCSAAYEEPPEPAIGSGDVNGDGSVDISDALLAMRCAMGIITLTTEQYAEADVNGDGSVDISDALIIMRKAMGLIDK